jgi:hypothetical protein
MGKNSLLARPAFRTVLLALAGIASLLIGVGRASADSPLIVCPSGCPFTTISDALAAANSGDTIVIGPGSYDGGLVISKNVSLRGAGSAATTITGSLPQLRGDNIVVPAGVSVDIRGVTIGPITDIMGTDVSNAGTLTLEDSIVTGGNTVFGGGITNGGTMALQGVLVTDNFGDLGGGIWNFSGGTMLIKKSTIAQNGAGLVGGGIYNEGMLTVKHSTISDNHSRADSGSPLNGGLVNTGVLSLRNTIVTDNTPHDCVGC